MSEAIPDSKVSRLKKKKTNPSTKKKIYTLTVGDELHNALGRAGEANFMLKKKLDFDVDAEKVNKETRNFLLAPTHTAYLDRPWIKSRALNEDDLARPTKIIPLLLRETTAISRPLLMLNDSETTTFVLYGNGHRVLEKNHILYDLDYAHGQALYQNVEGYFGPMRVDKIDYQHRYMLHSLHQLYGSALSFDPQTSLFAAEVPSRRVRVLVVDGLPSDSTRDLRMCMEDCAVSQTASCTRAIMESLCNASQWLFLAHSPADGRLCAKKLAAVAQTTTVDQPFPVQKKRVLEEDAPVKISVAVDGDPGVPDESSEVKPKKKKKKRSRSSSDDEESMSEGSGSDVRSSDSDSDSEHSETGSKSACCSEASSCDSDSDDKPLIMKCDERPPANPPANPRANPLKKRAKPDKKKTDTVGSIRQRFTERLDLILEMRVLFKDRLTEKLNNEVSNSVQRLKSLSVDYQQDGSIEQTRALANAQTDLLGVLMKALASVCHVSKASGGDSTHCKLATIMGNLYEGECSQFELVAKTMATLSAQMAEMVEKRVVVSKQAEEVAGELVEVARA